jgi:hypothetical protein
MFKSLSSINFKYSVISPVPLCHILESFCNMQCDTIYAINICSLERLL